MNKYISEFKEALKEARILKVLVFVLAVFFVLELFLIGKLSTNQKIIIIPDSLNRKVYITGDFADYSLIDAYGRNIINLYYNFIPENVEEQYKYLLTFFEPSVYSKTSATFMKIASEYKKNGASQIGHVKTFKIMKDKIVASVSVITFIGETKTSTYISNLEIGYKIDNYSFRITSFKENVVQRPETVEEQSQVR